MGSKMSNKKHVAVIGGGQSGLSSLQLMSEHPDRFSMVCFERAAEIGGQWLYTEDIGTDQHGMPVFSSMYDDLIINVPFALMEIPGFPHDSKKYERTYLNRHQMLQYLLDFTEKHNLRQYIKFETLVTKVRPLSDAEDTQWEVTYCDVRNRTELKSEVFDAVLVCHGHNDKPRMPVVEGVDVFKGTVFHSHDFRRNTEFKGKKLVLLGASYSGLDISHQLAKVADTVFLAHIKDPLPTALKPNVIEKPGIKRMTEDSVIFVDGSEEKVDALIYCTGFEYNMPFLDGVVTVNNEHVMPVFKNIVHIEHPSLMFIGLAKESAYFLLNHENARFAVQFLLGNFKLPTKKEMYEDELQEREYRKSIKMAPHQAHYVGTKDLQWKWNEEFAQIAGFKPLEPVIKMLWDVSIGKLDYDFVNFRDFDYYVTGSKSFEITHI